MNQSKEERGVRRGRYKSRRMEEQEGIQETMQLIFGRWGAGGWVGGGGLTAVLWKAHGAFGSLNSERPGVPEKGKWGLSLKSGNQQPPAPPQWPVGCPRPGDQKVVLCRN